MFNSQNWALDDTAVIGPDSVSYAELPTLGLRLDGVPVRQGLRAMEWRYSIVPSEDMQRLFSIWEQTTPSVKVRWLDPSGVWQTGYWHMTLPQIGKRTAFHNEGVVIRFIPIYYTGSGLDVDNGEDPPIYPGYDNPPPVANISYTVSVYGDPQVVVSLDGTGSTDADGVITAYAWMDNESAFTDFGLPPFDPPHTASSPTATFVYTLPTIDESTPNPVITLTVTDNAGQTDTEEITINLADLQSSSALVGRKIACAANSAVYYSLDGGVSWDSITGFSGDALSAAGAPGAIVFGTTAGIIYRASLETLPSYVAVYTMPTTSDDIPWVTCVSVAPTFPSMVLACTNQGAVALSRDSGVTWEDLTKPGMACVRAEFNINDETEMTVVGTDLATVQGLCKKSVDGGKNWISDISGLPYPAEGRAVQRSARLRYIGLQGAPTTPETSLWASSGETWIEVDLPDTADIEAIAMSTDGRCFVGDAQSRVYSILETTVAATATLEDAGAVHHAVVDPTDPNIALFGTDDGLWKTLDNLTTYGQLGLSGSAINMVALLRSGFNPNVEILVPANFSSGSQKGIWHHALATGWVLKPAPEEAKDGFEWVRGDPSNPDVWIASGPGVWGAPPLFFYTENAGRTWTRVRYPGDDVSFNSNQFEFSRTIPGRWVLQSVSAPNTHVHRVFDRTTLVAAYVNNEMSVTEGGSDFQMTLTYYLATGPEDEFVSISEDSFGSEVAGRIGYWTTAGGQIHGGYMLRLADGSGGIDANTGPYGGGPISVCPGSRRMALCCNTAHSDGLYHWYPGNIYIRTDYASSSGQTFLCRHGSDVTPLGGYPAGMADGSFYFGGRDGSEAFYGQKGILKIDATITNDAGYNATFTDSVIFPDAKIGHIRAGQAKGICCAARVLEDPTSGQVSNLTAVFDGNDWALLPGPPEDKVRFINCVEVLERTA